MTHTIGKIKERFTQHIDRARHLRGLGVMLVLAAVLLTIGVIMFKLLVIRKP